MAEKYVRAMQAALRAGCLRLHTHTHTYTQCVILIAFPQQKWLHERASMLLYTCIACLVMVITRDLLFERKT